MRKVNTDFRLVKEDRGPRPNRVASRISYYSAGSSKANARVGRGARRLPGWSACARYFGNDFLPARFGEGVDDQFTFRHAQRVCAHPWNASVRAMSLCRPAPTWRMLLIAGMEYCPRVDRFVGFYEATPPANRRDLKVSRTATRVALESAPAAGFRAGLGKFKCTIVLTKISLSC